MPSPCSPESDKHLQTLYLCGICPERGWQGCRSPEPGAGSPAGPTCGQVRGCGGCGGCGGIFDGSRAFLPKGTAGSSRKAVAGSLSCRRGWRLQNLGVRLRRELGGEGTLLSPVQAPRAGGSAWQKSRTRPRRTWPLSVRLSHDSTDTGAPLPVARGPAGEPRARPPTARRRRGAEAPTGRR